MKYINFQLALSISMLFASSADMYAMLTRSLTQSYPTITRQIGPAVGASAQSIINNGNIQAYSSQFNQSSQSATSSVQQQNTSYLPKYEQFIKSDIENSSTLNLNVKTILDKIQDNTKTETPTDNNEYDDMKSVPSYKSVAAYLYGKQGTVFDQQKRNYSTFNPNVQDPYAILKIAKTASPYEILQVSSTATDNELKAAKFKLLNKYHPDKYTDKDDKKIATQIAQIINQAYDKAVGTDQQDARDPYQSKQSNSYDDNGTYTYNKTQQQQHDYSKYSDIREFIDNADFNTIMSFIHEKKYTKKNTWNEVLLDKTLYNLVNLAHKASWWRSAIQRSPENLNQKEIFELIQACVQAGADVNSKHMKNPLLWEMFRTINSELTESINNQPNYLYLTIKYLLDQGADVNNVHGWDDKPRGALFLIALNSNADQPLLIDMLIKHGAEVTPEIVAAARKRRNNNAEILKSYVNSADPRYWFK